MLLGKIELPRVRQARGRGQSTVADHSGCHCSDTAHKLADVHHSGRGRQSPPSGLLSTFSSATSRCRVAAPSKRRRSLRWKVPLSIVGILFGLLIVVATLAPTDDPAKRLADGDNPTVFDPAVTPSSSGQARND